MTHKQFQRMISERAAALRLSSNDSYEQIRADNRATMFAFLTFIDTPMVVNPGESGFEAGERFHDDLMNKIVDVYAGMYNMQRMFNLLPDISVEPSSIETYLKTDRGAVCEENKQHSATVGYDDHALKRLVAYTRVLRTHILGKHYLDMETAKRGEIEQLLQELGEAISAIAVGDPTDIAEELSHVWVCCMCVRCAANVSFDRLMFHTHHYTRIRLRKGCEEFLFKHYASNPDSFEFTKTLSQQGLTCYINSINTDPVAPSDRVAFSREAARVFAVTIASAGRLLKINERKESAMALWNDFIKDMAATLVCVFGMSSAYEISYDDLAKEITKKLLKHDLEIPTIA